MTYRGNAFEKLKKIVHYVVIVLDFVNILKKFPHTNYF